MENLLRFSVPSAKTVNRNSDVNMPTSNKILHKTKENLKEESGELLSRALKRKFTELEEITQRLRSRLADVTREDWNISNDEFTEEFERDINSINDDNDFSNDMELERITGKISENPNSGLLNDCTKNFNRLMTTKMLTPEEDKHDYREHTIGSDVAYKSTFANEQLDEFCKPIITASFSSLSSQNALDDRQLRIGKQHIDVLLEKLSLVSEDNRDIFSNHNESCLLTNTTKMPNDVSTNNTYSTTDSGYMDNLLHADFFTNICSFNLNSSLNSQISNIRNDTSLIEMNNGNKIPRQDLDQSDDTVD